MKRLICRLLGHRMPQHPGAIDIGWKLNYKLDVAILVCQRCGEREIWRSEQYEQRLERHAGSVGSRCLRVRRHGKR